MRKLATIREIKEVQEIPGADNICLVIIDGWQCVAQKGEFQIGDACVYFEIDSIVPDVPMFEFMRARKFRVRTIKCMKQLSQGLAKPVSMLKEFTSKTFAIGDDVTDIIGVKKHDPEAEAEAKITRPKPRLKWWQQILAKLPFIGRRYRRLTGAMPFPVHIVSKTDEERYQNINPRLLSHWQGQEIEITEKVDGTSTTYIYKPKSGWFTPEEFMVCSRNQMLDKPDSSVYWEFAKTQKVKERMKALHAALNLPVNEYLILQGEIIAPNVQGNKYGVDCLKYYVFNMKSCNSKTRAAFQWSMKNATPHLSALGFDYVPALFHGKCENLEALMDGRKYDSLSKIASTIAEGFVARLADQNINGMKSFKFIHPAFLLKHNL